MSQAYRKERERPNLYRVGGLFVRGDVLLATSAIGVASLLATIALNSGPTTEAPATPTPRATETINLAAIPTATPLAPDIREIIVNNLKRGSYLLTTLEDMHYGDGLDAAFADCTQNGISSIEEHVERTVTLRKAPSQLRGQAIRELTPSEKIIQSAIDVTVRWQNKEPLAKKWSAQITGDGLTFIAREQEYRGAILKRFLEGTVPACEELNIDYLSYSTQPPQRSK